jgi:fructokinase
VTPVAEGRYIGIDLGGSKIEGVVLDAALAPVARTRLPTERERGYQHIVERVSGLAHELRRLAPACRGIGIGTPGSLSRAHGTLKNSNTVCLNGRPLLADLQARLDVPVWLENDANCFALAEARGGAGRGHRLVFGIILGTGVGGGIVWNGALWPGFQSIAGEWGHHRIDPGGPDCYCGRRGCVETYLSGPALEGAYARAGGPRCSASEIAARAARGETRASEILDDYCETFGRALANVINVLDPDVVVLGGGLSNVSELYGRGRDAVARWVFNDELRTAIVRNALGDSAGVIGAALLGADP